ncbi:hypothetical protein AKJ09_07997 [Labilithrix luteola]|uniref:Right handed beta helix domain-containing protein n=1 Tax=Labilithrix luteola TaxID=1391654 RepID=A0A0K1Q6J5_9BACT|nr:hypothetical protein AKJ09_07997 [Labilithrix luteola]
MFASLFSFACSQSDGAVENGSRSNDGTDTNGTDGSRDGSTTSDPSNDAGTGADGAPTVGCTGFSTIVEPSEQLFVAPNGNDSADGSAGAPLASLGEAARRFPNGGTVVVRGGAYGAQTLAGTGTAGHPLVVRAASGETPVFDGSAVQVPYGAVIRLTKAQHVVFANLTVQNGTGPNVAGILADEAVSDLTIRACTIHDTQDALARFAGDGITFEGNEMYNGALANEGNPDRYKGGGWPGCMGTTPDFSRPTSPWATNVTLRGNHVHDCWGEGLSIWFGSGVVVEDNVVERTFNVGIYLDNASNVQVARNFVLMQAPMAMNGGIGNGVLLGIEPYDTHGVSYRPNHDITIVDNVVVGASAIGWWTSPNTSPDNTYANVSILHNTLVAPSGAAIGFEAVSGQATSPKACTIENNVIVESSGSYLDEASAFTLAGNAWLGPSKPMVAGTSDVSLNISVGAVTTAKDVQSLASQVGTGVASTVAIDFACAARNAAAPTRGAFEH